MTALAWRAQFPNGCEIVLSVDAAAIARNHDADSQTRERYYAREAHRCETCTGAPRFCGPLLGPVQTLVEALELVPADVRDQLAPSRPSGTGGSP